MGGTQLKTDSMQRWMMYSKDAYCSGRLFLTAEQKQAAEAGKKFSQDAYADIWARDIALVRRVRSFLAQHFDWHQRLAKHGTDLEVIKTLQSMIRGDSVILVAEQSRTGGSSYAPAPKPQGLPSFRESLMTSYGMSYNAATDYIERYNAMVERINTTLERAASKAASALADDVREAANAATHVADTSTPLGRGQQFKYAPDDQSGDITEVAARGVSMTGNEPGGYRINPNGQDVDYFDINGNLCAQYHESHGPAHGHNFNDGVRNSSHLPMSPINCR